MKDCGSSVPSCGTAGAWNTSTIRAARGLDKNLIRSGASDSGWVRKHEKHFHSRADRATALFGDLSPWRGSR